MKSILVTGGSGSFGNAFTKHLLDHDLAERIVILSRGELAQEKMHRELQDERLRFFIGDVRDRDRLRRAFEGVEVVVHAAALKRIEVGQFNPSEMVKTNIIGAMNVIEAAHDAGVQKVVALSTDKAYQPISPYGQSKALAETLFLNANNTRGRNGPIYSVCRYGNIFGSNGSVVPTWRAALDKAKITDPECTRFFMRMSEAVALVLNTVENMTGGELEIPDLPAYRLGDLATAMSITPEVIGLPAWEKRHESMDNQRCSSWARRMSADELEKALNEKAMFSDGLRQAA